MNRELTHREKVSKSLKGNIGEMSRRWKGEEATYAAKHMWVKKHYGFPTKCENSKCKFKNPKRFEWANISEKYKRTRADWIMLCPSCHRKMDLFKKECKQGHQLVGNNLGITKQGWRYCKTCRNNQQKQYMEKKKNANN